MQIVGEGGKKLKLMIFSKYEGLLLYHLISRMINVLKLFTTGGVYSNAILSY